MYSRKYEMHLDFSLTYLQFRIKIETAEVEWINVWFPIEIVLPEIGNIVFCFNLVSYKWR